MLTWRRIVEGERVDTRYGEMIVYDDGSVYVDDGAEIVRDKAVNIATAKRRAAELYAELLRAELARVEPPAE